MNLTSVSHLSAQMSQQEAYVKSGDSEFYAKSTSIDLSLTEAAVYEKGGNVLTDTGYKVDMDKVLAMKEETAQRMVDLFKDTVEGGLGKQIKALKKFVKAFRSNAFGESDSQVQSSFQHTSISINIVSIEARVNAEQEEQPDFTLEDIEQAQLDVAEDGYWGAEAVSTRFLDFAKALSGGDVSKGEMLLEAVKAGYEAAEELWGEALPELSQNTLALTIEKFQEWINGEDEVD